MRKLRLLTEQVRARYAGSFTADANSLTPARARELAGRVVADWVARSEPRLVEEVNGGQPKVAIGLDACLAAAGNGAVGTAAGKARTLVSGPRLAHPLE